MGGAPEGLSCPYQNMESLQAYDLCLSWGPAVWVGQMLSFRMPQWHSDSAGALFLPVCVTWHTFLLSLSFPCVGMPLKA